MWFVGIDWSHQQLDYELRDAAGRVLSSGDVRSTTAGLAELFSKLDRHAPPEPIHMRYEAVNRAWGQATPDRGCTTNPPNPKASHPTQCSGGERLDHLLDRQAASTRAQRGPHRHHPRP